MADLDPFAMNVKGASDLVESNTNKVKSGAHDNLEGVAGEKEDVLKLDMDDEELLKLADKRVALYVPYESKIKPRQEKNKQYYLGQQKLDSSLTSDGPIAGNLLFEAEETFLPAALSKNPEPVVYCDNTPEGNKLSTDVKTMLQYHADQLVLRRKLAQVTRQWSIYFLGVLKHGWNEKVGDITTDVRKIQDFIFDPEGTVDAYGDFDSWLGERITVTAERLTELFPAHKAAITVLVDGQMGTPCTYTEWWEDDMCYVTFKDLVLDKHKNEFFNYPQPSVDEFGLPTEIPGKNHFSYPKKPYTFLSVFTLGEQPHDVTGLIEQNIPNQNLITRRTYQIDYNLSKSNNSDVFSEDNFNQETAKQAAKALAKGNPVIIPKGRPIADAIARLTTPGITDAFFKEQEGNKDALRSIFGVQGITAMQPDEDTTARGMILNQQYDNTRIGGGVGGCLEQVADNVFNWWLQLYSVFYQEEHFAAILGQMKAVEYVTLSAANLDRQLIISVAPNSMKPKDEITLMNQATELFTQGNLDPQTYFTVTNFPNPKETAAQVVLWKANPALYMQLNFPDLQALIASTVPMVPQVAHAGGEAAPVPGTPAPMLGGETASAALSQVPLPA